MEWLAHSADAKRKVAAQTYDAHVSGVIRRAVAAATDIERFAGDYGEILRSVVELAAEFHDLGKLDPQNQEVLSGRQTSRALPVQHTDAGTAHLIRTPIDGWPSAILVHAHHIGLPDIIAETIRGNGGDEAFRDKDKTIRERVNGMLNELVAAHQTVFEISHSSPKKGLPENFNEKLNLFLRIGLSCLADGDHTDTATHYGDCFDSENALPSLRASERLEKLDRYVQTLGNGDERSKLRSSVYDACRNAIVSDPDGFIACDSPVGTGKTTAIMAYLLKLAKEKNLRRIFVILPFTTIIEQSEIGRAHV